MTNAIIHKVSTSLYSTSLLLPNNNRSGATVYNDSNQPLFIALNNDASLHCFTLKLAPGSYWECPPGYYGSISGAWAFGATGCAMVTEF